MMYGIGNSDVVGGSSSNEMSCAFSIARKEMVNR
jgi:hypothetical protein